MNPSTTNTQEKYILVIDDEPHIITYLETLLNDNGYKTLTASNGLEAMEVIKTKKPDLICLDITMPEQTGIRFYRNIKDDPEFSNIPVVVITGITGYGGDPEPFKRFLNTRKQVPPPESILSKPINREEFMQIVKKYI